MVKSCEKNNIITKNSGRWTEDEHKKYVHGRSLNLSWDEISKFIGSRTADQCRSHHQKIRDKKVYVRIHGVYMKDEATQYEPPTAFFASKSVILLDSQCTSPLTVDTETLLLDDLRIKSDDISEDFEFASSDICEDFMNV